jgi:hypothetical protein
MRGAGLVFEVVGGDESESGVEPPQSKTSRVFGSGAYVGSVLFCRELWLRSLLRFVRDDFQVHG